MYVCSSQPSTGWCRSRAAAASKQASKHAHSWMVTRRVRFRNRNTHRASTGEHSSSRAGGKKRAWEAKIKREREGEKTGKRKKERRKEGKREEREGEGERDRERDRGEVEERQRQRQRKRKRAKTRARTRTRSSEKL